MWSNALGRLSFCLLFFCVRILFCISVMNSSALVRWLYDRSLITLLSFACWDPIHDSSWLWNAVSSQDHLANLGILAETKTGHCHSQTVDAAKRQEPAQDWPRILGGWKMGLETLRNCRVPPVPPFFCTAAMSARAMAGQGNSCTT